MFVNGSAAAAAGGVPAFDFLYWCPTRNMWLSIDTAPVAGLDAALQAARAIAARSGRIIAVVDESGQEVGRA
jgi:hypothetical protein